MYEAQDVMSSAASNYDVPRLFLGTGLAILVCILGFFTVPSLRPLSPAGLYYSLTLTLYAILMFASSYVEEEHNFWYWITSGWFFYLYLSSLREPKKNSWLLHPALMALAIHRIVRRWNQTGQKFAGADDIVTSGIFYGINSILLWVLVGATYLDVTNRVSRHIARSVATVEESASASQVDSGPEQQHRMMGSLIATPLCVSAIVFKLAFTVKDAPELTYAISDSIMGRVEMLDLVDLARMVFGGIALVFVWLLFSEYQRSTRRAKLHMRGNGGTSIPVPLYHHSSLTMQTSQPPSSTCLRSSCSHRLKHRTYLFTSFSESSSSCSVSPFTHPRRAKCILIL
jgi:ethanolaminephosphotransferase